MTHGAADRVISGAAFGSAWSDLWPDPKQGQRRLSDGVVVNDRYLTCFPRDFLYYRTICFLP